MMRILVLQLKRIGDLILTTPALAALRQHDPEAHITLCVAEGSAGLTPAMPFVNEVMAFRRVGRNFKLLARLASSHYDVCLDFTGNDRSALYSLLSKAPRRIAFGWVRKSAFRPMFYNEFVDSSVREKHTIDHHLDLLKPLGIQARGLPVTLQLPAEAREKAAALLASVGLGGEQKFAVVHPGTARPEKFWLPERWAEVIDHCQGNLCLPCVVTGTQDITERRHLEAITARARTSIRDLTGKMDLLVLAALIERAHLLLSMDSAPVHLGAAFGTRQVSMFGETNPFHWRPRHEKAAVLLAGNDAPLKEFTPRCARRPLSDLSTQNVIAAIDSLS